MKKKSLLTMVIGLLMLTASFIPAVLGNSLDVLVRYVSQPVIKELAQRAVEAYSPSHRSNGFYYSASVYDFHDWNTSCYNEALFDSDEEQTLESIDMVPRLLIDAVANPMIVKAFYAANIDLFIDEMKDAAIDLQTGSSVMEGHTRAQVKEMFFLYQEQAKGLSSYINFAITNAEKLKSLFAEVKKAEEQELSALDEYRQAGYDDTTKHAEYENAFSFLKEKEQQILEESGPGLLLVKGEFDKAYPILWLERRRAVGGEQLLKVYQEIAEDLANRLEHSALSF